MDDTAGKELVSNFKTRRSTDIIDALGGVLSAQESRTHAAMAAEKQYNEKNPDEPKFSPEVTKMLATLFDQGVTLARLVDPTLGLSGRKRSAIETQAHESLAGSTPREVAAALAGEIESMGLDPAKATEEEVLEALRRQVPASTMPSYVDDDEAPDADGDGGSPVVASQPGLRAAPRFNP